MQSLLAGLGVPKEERQFLGRWSASGSDEYVRTYRLMVKRMLGKLGEVIDNKQIFEVVDEAEALESLKERAEKGWVLHQSLRKPCPIASCRQRIL